MSDDIELDPHPVVDPARVAAWLSRLRFRDRPPQPADRVPRPAPGARAGDWRSRSLLAIIVLGVALWGATGFYKVQPDQMGLVLRFGRWVATRGPGLNYHLPTPIETVLLPKVTEVNQLRIGNGAITQMLTGDENIVEATAAVTWRIREPEKYLFNVYDPEGTVAVAAEGAVRQIVGLNPIQAALSDQRQKIAEDAQKLLQRLLDSYDTGIEVTQVQLQRVDPPTAVIDAFNDVQRARADQSRIRNESEAYRRDILPRARGDAERIRQEAQAYREQAVNQSQGEAARFIALQASYHAAPDLTARRLYLEAMEDVLKSANKVMLSPGASGGPALVPYMALPPPAFRPVPP